MFITFALAEVCLMIAAKSAYINILMPTYTLNPHEDFLPVRSYIYGHQHLPNSSYTVKKFCLETHYQFNKLGFRDQLESQSSSKKRVLSIGDSFVEGVGVKEDERFTDLIENKSQLTHLNFGMADKGSTQAYLIYDSIAKHYEHSSILWSLFPTNDLIDDDPDFGKTVNGIKPCWSGEYPNYDLKYFPSEAPKEKPNKLWKRILKNFTYTYDALFYLKESLKLKFSEPHQFPKTGYFNYSIDQLNRMKYSINQLKKSAKNKPITIICIPSTIDLDNTKARSQENIEESLKSYCENLDIEFIGLFDLFMQDKSAIQKYYYECDSHWNPNGHILVADYLLKHSRLYNH